MEQFIIVILMLVSVVAVSLWLREKGKARLLRRSATATESGWSSSYKALNQKLNDAQTRLIADKPLVELGRRRKVSLDKAEAKRKSKRAAVKLLNK